MTQRVVELGISSQDNGSRIVGTGFEPGKPVTVEVASQGSPVAATVDAGADGSIVVVSTLTGTYDVTVSSAAASRTSRMDLNKRLPDTFTPAELTTIEKRAESLRATEGLKSQVNPFLSGASLGDQIDAMFLQIAVQMRDQESRVLGQVPGGASTEVPIKVGAGSTFTLDAGQQAALRQQQFESAGVTMIAGPMAALRPPDKYTKAQADLETSKELIAKSVMEAEATRSKVSFLASTPVVVQSGALPTNGLVKVKIPADFTGIHHVGVVDQASGAVIAWQAIEVVAPVPSAPPVTPPAATPATPPIAPPAATVAAASKVVVKASASRPPVQR